MSGICCLKPTLIKQTINWLTEFVLSPLPFDVRFSFPRSGQDLWANSGLLKQASPYFKSMFDSGFQESKVELCTLICPRTTATLSAELDWTDSDDEGPLGPAATQPSRPPAQHALYSITVTDHSFVTYRAVWVWIITRSIKFSHFKPCSSSAVAGAASSAPDAAAPQPPAKRLKPSPATDAASASSTVSCKSVYRLAHKLELTSLMEDAVDAFEANLTVDNVARELFSSAAATYDELRDAAAEFAVEHWDVVEKSAGMKEMMAKVERGEMDQAGLIMKAVAEAALTKARTA